MVGDVCLTVSTYLPSATTCEKCQHQPDNDTHPILQPFTSRERTGTLLSSVNIAFPCNELLSILLVFSLNKKGRCLLLNSRAGLRKQDCWPGKGPVLRPCPAAVRSKDLRCSCLRPLCGDRTSSKWKLRSVHSTRMAAHVSDLCIGLCVYLNISDTHALCKWRCTICIQRHGQGPSIRQTAPQRFGWGGQGVSSPPTVTCCAPVLKLWPAALRPWPLLLNCCPPKPQQSVAERAAAGDLQPALVGRNAATCPS